MLRLLKNCSSLLDDCLTFCPVRPVCGRSGARGCWFDAVDVPTLQAGVSRDAPHPGLRPGLNMWPPLQGFQGRELVPLRVALRPGLNMWPPLQGLHGRELVPLRVAFDSADMLGHYRVLQGSELVPLRVAFDSG